MEKKVLTQKWFDSLIRQNFVALKLYAASGEKTTRGADEFVQKYNIRGYPTFLYLTPEEEVFYRWPGLSPDTSSDGMQAFWQKQVQEVLSYYGEFPMLKQRFEQGDRSPELVRRYFLWALNVGDPKTFQTAWEAYLKAYPSIQAAWFYDPLGFVKLLEAADRFSVARAYALSISDSLKALLPEKEWTALYRLLLYQEVSTKMFEWSQKFMRQGLAQPLIHVAETTLTYAKSLQARFPFVEEMVLKQLADTLLKTKDAVYYEAAAGYYDQYFKLTKSAALLDSAERVMRAYELNDIAWKVYENVDNPTCLGMAINWVKEALTYRPNSWYTWDTLGALYYKLKRKNEAIEALSEALSIAKSKKTPPSQYKSTEELLQKAQALE
jgi:tetratricopeptide (TPR) repeat protein